MIVYKHKWILKQLENEKTVYDMGCNGDDKKAFLNRFLKEKLPNSKIIGVDIANGPNVDIVHDLNKKFPSDWRADCIVASSIMNYLLEPFRFLRGCHKILSDDGKLILVLGNAGYYFSFKSFVERDKRHLHNFSWTMDTFCNLLKKSGFEVIKKEFGMAYYKLTPRLVLSGLLLLEYMLCSIFPMLSTNLCIVARKQVDLK